MPKGQKKHLLGSFTRNGICPCCDKAYRGNPAMVSKLITLHIKTAHKDFDMNRVAFDNPNKRNCDSKFSSITDNCRFGRDYKNKERQEMIAQIRANLKASISNP